VAVGLLYLLYLVCGLLDVLDLLDDWGVVGVVAVGTPTAGVMPVKPESQSKENGL
jgi:hypothetical protein